MCGGWFKIKILLLRNSCGILSKNRLNTSINMRQESSEGKVRGISLFSNRFADPITFFSRNDASKSCNFVHEVGDTYFHETTYQQSLV